MRIAHITATFPPYLGGTGSVCYHNAREMVQRGHQVTVWTAAYPDTPERSHIDGIDVRRLKPLFRVGNAPLLPDLLRLRDVDVIHLHYPFIFGAEMIGLASLLRRIPYVLTYHNDLIGLGARRWMFNAYSAVFARWLTTRAAKILAVSRDHALHCDLSPLFVRRGEDLVEMPNGVDLDRFYPTDGGPTRQHFGIPNDTNVVLFVGGLDQAHHFKRIDLLLRAIQQVNDAYLLIVGEGDLRPGLEQLARELGVLNRVCFVGGVREGLAQYYAAADMVVLASLPPESFGLVLVEAMACGKPVIASNIPGVRSVVDEGVDGLLVRAGDVDDLAQKLCLLLDDPSRRQAMGAAGRLKVEQRYSWKAIAPRLEQIYREVAR